MPETPPVPTLTSFCVSTIVPPEVPFAEEPLTTAVDVPFAVPLGCELGRVRSPFWSVDDMGKDKEVGETNSLAWAAVVGTVKDSMAETQMERVR